MRIGPIALGIVAGLLPAGNVHAGTVELLWGGCTSPVVTHQVVQPGGLYGLYARVRDPEANQGYRFSLRLRTAGPSSIPDAWCFDAEGCHDTKEFQAYARGPAAYGKCPPDLPGAQSSIESSLFSYDATSGTATFGVVHDYAMMPARVGAYHVAMFHFSHFGSVPSEPGAGECGGLSDLVCFMVERADYLDENGDPHPWTVVDPVVSAAGPGVSPDGCLAVPARASTWGRLKASFR
jgi:hypothetical protein